MKLNAPKNLTFLISVILFVAAIIFAFFVKEITIFQRLSVDVLLFHLAFIVLALGNLLKDF